MTLRCAPRGRATPGKREQGDVHEVHDQECDPEDDCVAPERLRHRESGDEDGGRRDEHRPEELEDVLLRAARRYARVA